jgi:glyoxylase-like metal-dependent hydrolase (beta-lactamase superfamily II)
MTKMSVVNQKKQDYYTICNITDSVYQINMHNHVFSYLIIGNQKALLIDTGWGTVDIKSIVESLTSLPLIVVNTHGHLDHMYGNYQFEEVFIKEEDAMLIAYDYTKEKREYVMKRFGNPMLPFGITLDDWLNVKPNKTSYLNNVKHFDLGNRIIEIIDIPGHSRGSIGLLDRKERLLFSGDSILNSTIFLHFNLSTKLNVYLKGIENLIALKSNFDFIYPSHPFAPIEPNFLYKVKDSVKQIIKGESIGEKREVYGRACLLCDFDGFAISIREDSI